MGNVALQSSCEQGLRENDKFFSKWLLEVEAPYGQLLAVNVEKKIMADTA